MRDYCLGIDLGTTNTVCAVWNAGDPRPAVVPIDQPYDDFTLAAFKKDALLPSAVTIRPDGVFVGHAARHHRRADDTVWSVKRQMGRHWCRQIAGTTWTPERISACILRAVRDEIATAHDREPARVVITVPASFGTEQRRATLAAAQLAGFPLGSLRLFDEPTAALLSELCRDGSDLAREEGRTSMVVDIGGGTLDVSFVELKVAGGRLVADVQGRSRYNELAGDDFDLAVAGLLLGRFQQDTGIGLDTQQRADRAHLCLQLLLRAEEVKRRLSLVLDARVPVAEWGTVKEPLTIPRPLPSIDRWDTEVSGRDLLDALVRFFPHASEMAVRRRDYSFFRPITECLESVKIMTGRTFLPHEVGEVWLTGGSARLPIVPVAVRAVTHERPRVVSDPMDAVALGAAWYAGILEGWSGARFAVQDRLFDGIFLQPSAGAFKELVSPREAVPMPRRRVEEALTMSAHDRRIDVNLFTGLDATDDQMAPLARRRVDFGRLLPKGTRITIDVAITDDRRADFAFTAVVDGAPVRGAVQISTAADWEVESGEAWTLPPVNPRLGGVS